MFVNLNNEVAMSLILESEKGLSNQEELVVNGMAIKVNKVECTATLSLGNPIV